MDKQEIQSEIKKVEQRLSELREKLNEPIRYQCGDLAVSSSGGAQMLVNFDDLRQCGGAYSPGLAFVCKSSTSDNDVWFNYPYDREVLWNIFDSILPLDVVDFLGSMARAWPCGNFDAAELLKKYHC